MSRILFFTALLLILFFCQAYALDVEGHITEDTDWEGDINVVGEVTIDDGVTLTIYPGSYVEFLGHYKLNVQGKLLAIGSEQAMITFTAADTSVGWHGIRFDNTPAANDSSQIVYCKLEYGKAVSSNIYECLGGAIYTSFFSKILISNCYIINNYAGGDGGGISCRGASPVIVNNNISNNIAYEGGGAIGCSGSSNPLIINNIISNNTGVDYTANGGGISMSWSSPIIIDNIIINNDAHYGGGISCGDFGYPIIINNIIANNTASPNSGNFGSGGGIYIGGTSPSLINNTISNNMAYDSGGGITCFSSSSPIFTNNIIWGNSVENGYGEQLAIWDDDSDPDFYYCDVQGGTGAFGLGDGVSYDGIYENNISSNPDFNTANIDHPYSLLSISPCIDAGDPDTSDLNLPEFDMAGNLRIWDGDDSGTTIIDMGAYEYGAPVTFIKNNNFTQIPEKTILLQNYPNPFNPTTTIQFKVSQNGDHLQGGLHLTLNIYDISGKLIKILVNEEKEPGYHSVVWDGKDEQGNSVASGVYIYRIEAGSYHQNKKCILLR